eukprot:TRINITY_DN5999_c0_g1_i7.p1 TRINITY_DN5999_c0_g1~~TRINITY_DN5999_c0_g1_i7.p1  ORF type:complete len:323 (+),score=37.97 TRINITY_DN5999_c0_g1_i7:73-1041(+)
MCIRDSNYIAALFLYSLDFQSLISNNQIMEIRKVPQGYSNGKIVAASVLSFLTAATILILFIIFISISRPSFKDLCKYAFTALCLTICLFITYGVCGFLKASTPQAYASKMFTVSLITCIAIIGLDIAALIRVKDHVLPTVTFALSIGVGLIVLLVSLEYYLHGSDEGSGVGEGPGYVEAPSLENRESELTLRNEKPKSGYELGDDKSQESTLRNDIPLAEHSLRKEINPPRSALMNTYKKSYGAGKASWEKTHFMLGIEAGGKLSNDRRKDEEQMGTDNQRSKVLAKQGERCCYPCFSVHLRLVRAQRPTIQKSLRTSCHP